MSRREERKEIGKKVCTDENLVFVIIMLHIFPLFSLTLLALLLVMLTNADASVCLYYNSTFYLNFTILITIFIIILISIFTAGLLNTTDLILHMHASRQRFFFKIRKSVHL